MTALEEVRMPSCPLCGENEQVTRDMFGQKNPRHAYLCGACWAVFDGSQDEWHHHKTHRERQQKRRKDQSAEDS